MFLKTMKSHKYTFITQYTVVLSQSSGSKQACGPIPEAHSPFLEHSYLSRKCKKKKKNGLTLLVPPNLLLCGLSSLILVVCARV